MSTSEILGFVAEWYDPQPQMTKQYLVKVFSDTNCIEIYDKRTNKVFLKKCDMPSNLAVKDFMVGAKVSIHARVMTVIDFADSYTRRKLKPMAEGATLLLSPDASSLVGQILGDLTEGTGLVVSKLKSVALKESELGELLPMLGLDTMPYEATAKFWCGGGVSHAIELKGVPDCRAVVSDMAQRLRRHYGTNDIEAAVWYADGLDTFFFGKGRTFEPSALMAEGAVTCVVVRPHAVKAGHLPAMIDAIATCPDFKVSAMELFYLNKTSAAEFLEVYDGVMPNFRDMVTELSIGACVALEVVARSNQVGQVVGAFRDFAGPWDVEMAKELRPTSLRALFGEDRTRNALHCTDMPEDGASESAYFFDVLQSA